MSTREIVLANLPFADVRLPSIALTQLKHVLEAEHGSRIRVRVLNLNHDFAAYLGHEFYQEIAVGMRHHASGLGDWLFRRAAYPALADNADAYFNRYYPLRGNAPLDREALLRKRDGIPAFLDDAIARYEIASADILGLTSMFSQNVACFALARAVKAANPGTVTLMGGANCEYPMGREIVEQVAAVDYVFSGPGLISLSKFVACRLQGDAAGEHRIHGVFSKSNRPLPAVPHADGPAVATDVPAVGIIGQELPLSVPIPLAYDDFLESFEHYFRDAALRVSLPFETSRGCWWGEKSHCTFCGLNGASMAYRSMPPELAVEHIRSLFRYAPRCERFQCVDNILPKSFVSEVLPHLDTPAGTSIFYEVKADLSDDDVRALADARVLTIQPGVEALASSTLKLMKKGTTAFQNVALLKRCLTYGVTPEWNLLIGFPGESDEVYEKYIRDIPNLVHLEPPSGAFPVRFDRFSPYFTQAKAYGLDLRPLDFYSLTYPFPESSIENLAVYFYDGNYDADYFVRMLKWLKPLQVAVEAWKACWARAAADRPRLELVAGDGGAHVLDTRGAAPVRHELGELGVSILRDLETQAPADRIAARFDSVPGAVVTAEIAALKRAGLLFEESGRLMSLVLIPRPRQAGSPPLRAAADLALA